MKDPVPEGQDALLNEVWTFSLNGTVDEMAAPPPVQTKVALTGALIKIGDPEGNTNTLAGDIIFAGTVDVLDYLYMPQRVAVPAGTTVSWKNGGDIVHTATSQDNSWDTGDIQPGQTTSITFNSAGTFTYACTPHPWMVAQVVVQ